MLAHEIVLSFQEPIRWTRLLAWAVRSFLPVPRNTVLLLSAGDAPWRALRLDGGPACALPEKDLTRAREVMGA